MGPYATLKWIVLREQAHEFIICFLKREGMRGRVTNRFSILTCDTDIHLNKERHIK